MQKHFLNKIRAETRGGSRKSTLDRVTEAVTMRFL